MIGMEFLHWSVKTFSGVVCCWGSHLCANIPIKIFLYKRFVYFPQSAFFHWTPFFHEKFAAHFKCFFFWWKMQLTKIVFNLLFVFLRVVFVLVYVGHHMWITHQNFWFVSKHFLKSIVNRAASDIRVDGLKSISNNLCIPYLTALKEWAKESAVSFDVMVKPIRWNVCFISMHPITISGNFSTVILYVESAWR